MDPNIIARLNTYAEDAAVMALRIEDLEADNRILREMLSVALDAIRDVSAERDSLRARHHHVLDENRRLRASLSLIDREPVVTRTYTRHEARA